MGPERKTIEGQRQRMTWKYTIKESLKAYKLSDVVNLEKLEMEKNS